MTPRLLPAVPFGTAYAAFDGVLPPHRLIIVNRDRRDTLHSILDAPERWPVGTAVMLDRRKAERRVLTQRMSLERRQRARRAEPDSQWHTHGFIVVETPTLPKQAIVLPVPRPFPGPRPAEPGQ
jgi:hypothetical protein